MRPIMIAGVVLLGLGAFLLIRGGSFTTRRDVLQVGEVKVTADQKQSLPSWAGWVVVTVGFGCLMAGNRQKA